jgi:hypothetical protein
MGYRFSLKNHLSWSTFWYWTCTHRDGENGEIPCCDRVSQKVSFNSISDPIVSTI